MTRGYGNNAKELECRLYTSFLYGRMWSEEEAIAICWINCVTTDLMFTSTQLKHSQSMQNLFILFRACAYDLFCVHIFQRPYFSLQRNDDLLVPYGGVARARIYGIVHTCQTDRDIRVIIKRRLRYVCNITPALSATDNAVKYGTGETTRCTIDGVKDIKKNNFGLVWGFIMFINNNFKKCKRVSKSLM